MFKLILVFLLSFLNLFSNDLIIGKYDRIDLPFFNLENIKSKIDTGAKTSSLHCSFIESSDGKYVTFIVLDKKDKKYTLPIKRVARVRSSNAIIENRYVISTDVVIFKKRYNTEFTLRDRHKMKYPILLGREFLEKGFLVDVKKEYLSYIQK